MNKLTTRGGQVDVPGWAADYIGLEFEAKGRGPKYDCWALLVKVLREQFGKEVPAHDGIGFEAGCDRKALAAFIDTHKQDWLEIQWGEERPGDGLLLRMMGHPIHVAVVVGRGWMLHIEEGIDACLERYDGPKWRRRVMGIYRYQALGGQRSADSQRRLAAERNATNHDDLLLKADR